MPDAQIIKFPGSYNPDLEVTDVTPRASRVCDDCDHAAFSSRGVYCIEFHEEIWNSSVADECEQYEPAFPIEDTQ